MRDDEEEQQNGDRGHERIRSEDCPSEYWHECWKPEKDSRYAFCLDSRGHETLGNPACQFVETASIEHQPNNEKHAEKGTHLCAFLDGHQQETKANERSDIWCDKQYCVWTADSEHG